MEDHEISDLEDALSKIVEYMEDIDLKNERAGNPLVLGREIGGVIDEVHVLVTTYDLNVQSDLFDD